MNRREHALHARLLIAACGGLVEAASRCRVGKTVRGDYQNPNGEGFMPADVIAELEAYCGAPIYSRALVEACGARAASRDLITGALDITEQAAGFQREVREALADDTLTSAERTALQRRHAALAEQLAAVGQALAREGS